MTSINYYETIMGSKTSCFLPTFNRLWNDEISKQNLPYINALQINTGNRLRPLLMAWGYYANCSYENNTHIADYAISIELIHKSTILFDDLIDEDIARHGLKTFHIQYSEAEALLYATYILNRGLSLMHEKDILCNTLHTSILLKTIDNIFKGGIKEVSSKEYAFSIADVKEIINLETVSLIESSFVLGYRVSCENLLDIPEDITNIGIKCGYCFQILNDIEPFSAPNINQKYKGITNYDFGKHRKNIVISFLLGACTSKEREQLKYTSDFSYVCTLAGKYEIIQKLIEEVETNIRSIIQSVNNLQKEKNEFYSDFIKFLIDMFKICFDKCKLPLSYELFKN